MSVLLGASLPSKAARLVRFKRGARRASLSSKTDIVIAVAALLNSIKRPGRWYYSPASQRGLVEYCPHVNVVRLLPIASERLPDGSVIADHAADPPPVALNVVP